MTADCSKQKAFGLFPVGSRVNWSFTKLLSLSPDKQHTVMVIPTAVALLLDRKLLPGFLSYIKECY